MNNYIEGVCFTNLDDYDCNVVTKFVAVPNKGDRVVVRYKGERRYLKVVGISHEERIGVPFITIELHN